MSTKPAKREEMPEVIGNRTSLLVYDQMTVDEKAELNEGIVELVSEIQNRKDLLKAQVALEKAAIKELATDLAQKVRDSRAGTVERTIAVTIVPNLNNNTVDFIDDTGTVRKSRRLTAAERQYMMDNDGGTVISIQNKIA